MPTINKVVLKKSSVAGKKPAVGALEIGEVAINLTDRVMFTKDSSGNIVELSPMNIPVFDATCAYREKDLVCYLDVVYIATADVPVGSWDAADWETFGEASPQIATNTANIATNTSNISANTTAIALNTSKVSVPAAGATGELLTKVDGVDYNVAWAAPANPFPANAVGSLANDGAGTLTWQTGTVSTVPWSGVTATPTTLAGYGITDGGGTDILPLDNTFTGDNTFEGDNEFVNGITYNNGSFLGEGAGADSFRAGKNAGLNNQGSNAFALGKGAANSNQGERSVAIGNIAGNMNQGAQSVAIGYAAGNSGQGDNGIIIGTTGAAIDDTTNGHVHITSSLASLDYTAASGWSLMEGTTERLAVDAGGLSVNGIVMDLTGNQEYTVEEGSGSGTAAYTEPTLLVTGSVDITGTGPSNYGQIAPIALDVDATYNVDKSFVFGAGALFRSQATLNFTGAPPISAGAFLALQDLTTIDNLHTTAIAMAFQASVNIGQSLKATTSSLSVTDFIGVNASGRIEGSDVSVTRVTCFKANPLSANQGAQPVGTHVGFHAEAKAANVTNAVGFHYGPTVATTGDWAFNSASSNLPSRFGGGVVNSYREATTSITLSAADHTVVILNGGNVVLPALNTVTEGQTYKIMNDSGSQKTITSASAIGGRSVLINNDNSCTAVAGSTKWYLGF